MLLDDFLPDYDFNEVHSIVIKSSPGHIYRSIMELLPGELSPVVNMLFAIRSFPERLVGRTGLQFTNTKPLIEQMLKKGFILLIEQPSSEFVFGMIVPRTIGQFWKSSSGTVPELADAREFVEFNHPDYAKVAANFYVNESDVNGLTKVSTESRIKAFSPSTRKSFAVYWKVIYPGSSLIRKMWLKAIKRRAEQSKQKLGLCSRH